MPIMTAMRRPSRAGWFLAVGLLAGCAAQPPAAGTDNPPTTDPALAGAVDTIAANALEQGPVAGISIAVMRGSNLIVDRGYGLADLENGIAATAQTIYDVASVTKLFTAAAIVQLVEAGHLSLEDNLTGRLPGFPNPEQGRRITVRHLLSHTSGLRDYEAAGTERLLADGTHLSAAFVLEFLRGRPLDFEPGSQWSYSNTGFYLLALIIERVTGRAYGFHIREALARPLGLTDTFLCDDALVPDRRTRGYHPVANVLVPSVHFTARNIIGDGGLCSTAGDLARLPGALRRTEVLSGPALARMTEPTALTSGVAVDYGLGVRRGVFAGHRLWGHTGGMSTYWAALFHYPDDDVTIVVLANTDDAATDALTIEGQIARAVFGVEEPALGDVAVPPATLRTLSREYEDGTGRIRISVAGARLQHGVVDRSRPPRLLLFQGDHTFSWAEYPMDRLIFHESRGQAVGLSEYYNGMFATFRRVATVKPR
jgi:CubicO group peptidase (beta-lactamase class C family)